MYSACSVWFSIISTSVLFTVINSRLLVESKVTKCCAFDEFILLQNSTYTCEYLKNSSVLPLKFNSVNFDTGIPLDCNSGLKTCVDKTVDNKIVELLCDTEEIVEKKPLPTIYKCCPQDMFYNKSTKACDFDTFSDENLFKDNSADVYNLQIGAPPCEGALVDYIISENFEIKNGDLVWTADGTNERHVVKNGTYCIDRSRNKATVMLRKCETMFEACKSRTCVPKCCPHGQIYLQRPKLRAICINVWNHTFISNFHDIYENITDRPKDMAVLPRPVCRNNKYVFTRNEYQLLPNGTLKSGTIYFNSTEQKFCIETTVNPLTKSMHEIAVICFPPVPFTPHWYYFVGLLISVIFLALTLFVYFMLPELQNLHGKTVMCHTASLLIAYVCLIPVKRNMTNYSWFTCAALGYSILFSFASAFSWLNVMCFDIWWTFGVMNVGLGRRNNTKKFLYYCLYAFGLPLVLTSIVITIDNMESVPEIYKSQIGKAFCWFNVKGFGHAIYFSTPIGVLITCNLILFILTARHCFKIKADIARMRDTDTKRKRFLADKATFFMNLKLFVVMGITWIFEIVSTYVKEPEILWLTIDTMNVLQGLWIFCIFVIKDKVWKSLRHQLGYRFTDASQITQTTNTSVHKNSVCSMTSLKVSGIKPEEMELIQNSLKKNDEWSKKNETETRKKIEP